ARIAKHLKDENYPAEKQSEFAGWVERLNAIRELRNHIAHSHFYIRPNEDPEKAIVSLFRSQDLDTGLLPESRHVEFPELLAAVGTLTGLLEEFKRMAGIETEEYPDHESMARGTLVI